MSEAHPGPLRRLWNGFWRAVDFSRRTVVNLVFLLVVVFVVAAMFGFGSPKTEPGSALMLAPRGSIVEQYSADPSDRVIAKLTGDEIMEVQLRDLLRALEAAQTDPNIDLIVIRPEQLSGGGIATLREVGRALERVRAAGKEIIAYGDYYDQRGYYLAAHADRVYMSPNGGLLLQGLGRYRSYYASLLDKLKVDVHVFRVGTYKSAVEPYLLDGPSDAAREADQLWLDDLWDIYLADVSKARGLEPGFITRWIDELPTLVEGSGGHFAKLALDSGLVDELINEDEFEKLLADRGSVDPQSKRARRVGIKTYIQRLPAQAPAEAVVGVVVAEGTIVDGEQPQGSIGGVSTAALVRKAREDAAVKALVLRVDSGGGSAFASEQIRRELQLTREAGKPVVISMGDVAASGGYWISMSNDALYADEATITGSIGIFGLFPTVDRTLDAVGMHADGASTTWLAGALDPRQPLDPRVGQIIQSSIEYGYEDFIGKVADSRETTPEQIDTVAQGRVWSGSKAAGHDLIDNLGSYTDALADAAERAGLGPNFQVRYIEKEMTGFQRFVMDMAASSGLAGKLGLDLDLIPAQLRSELRRMQSLEALFGDAREHPWRTYAHCLCDIE